MKEGTIPLLMGLNAKGVWSRLKEERHFGAKLRRLQHSIDPMHLALSVMESGHVTQQKRKMRLIEESKWDIFRQGLIFA